MASRKRKYQRKPTHHHPKPPENCGGGGGGGWCCGGARFSVCSSEGAESSSCAARPDYSAVSNAAHVMVQARLERMIEQRKESCGNERRRREKRAAAAGGNDRRCIILVASEKSSYDPRGDFVESMLEVIRSNGVEEPRELRRLLKCYFSVNSPEHRRIILEAFHEVCTSLFS